MSMCHTAFVTEIKGRGTRHAQDSYRVLGMITEPTGTDGHRTIGRTFPSSLLQNFSLVEMIFLSTDTQRPTRMISFLTHNAIQVLTLIGKYLLLSGLP